MCRFRCSLTILASLAIACGCSKNDSSKDGTSGEVDDLSNDDIPTFETTSSEPIALRYNLKAGQKLRISMEQEADSRLQFSDGNHSRMRYTVKVDASATVTAVDAQGNMSLDVRYTRIAVKHDDGPPGASFDTDDLDPADRKTKSLKAVLGARFSWKASPRGFLLHADIDELRHAMEAAGKVGFESLIEEYTSKLFSHVFPQLPKNPVKPDDKLDGGILATNTILVHLQYRVAAISGDRSQVALEVMGHEEIRPDGELKLVIKDQKLTGWVLFDVAQGYPSKLKIRMRSQMDLTREEYTGTSDWASTTVVTTRLE